MWLGGYGVVSPLEQRLSEVATGIAHKPASVFCNSPEQWIAQATSFDVDPAAVSGFVPETAAGRLAAYTAPFRDSHAPPMV